MAVAPSARCSVSLFSGGGVGDLGVHYGARIPVIACSELLPDRARMLRAFYPDASIHEGDLWVEKKALIASVQTRLGGRRPFLLTMSPPCQGMSSNGAGRIAAAVAKGTRPKEDPRNRLVLPALEVAEALNPDVVLLENVKHMQRTVITNEHGELENALDIVRRRLAAYRFEVQVLDASWYGVPQKRQRLIAIGTRDARDFEIPLHCPPTHRTTPVSLAAAIGHLPPLDACKQPCDPHDDLHRVPTWTAQQHFCMRHTPEGATAFDNRTCVTCGTDNSEAAAVCATCQVPLARPLLTTTEATCRGCDSILGKWKSCDACGPGTEVETKTQVRLVKAFRTAYRRMRGNEPAPTLTTTSAVISSDNKGHPQQHRVLSVREVLIVASLLSHPGFEAPWEKVVSHTFASFDHRTLREVAGESIPPLVLWRLTGHLLRTRTEALGEL